MAKKSKKIEKEPKQSKPAAQPTCQKLPFSQLSGVFTQSFKQRLQQFGTLNDQVLTLRQNLEGGDFSNEVKERKQRIAIKIEQAASSILKEEQKSLQEWIGEQKKKIEQEIKKISKAYDQNKNSLLGTGSFSEEEANNQLAGVQNKIEQRQKSCKGYDLLLDRIKATYS